MPLLPSGRDISEDVCVSVFSLSFLPRMSYVGEVYPKRLTQTFSLNGKNVPDGTQHDGDDVSPFLFRTIFVLE